MSQEKTLFQQANKNILAIHFVKNSSEEFWDLFCTRLGKNYSTQISHQKIMPTQIIQPIKKRSHSKKFMMIFVWQFHCS